MFRLATGILQGRSRIQSYFQSCSHPVCHMGEGYLGGIVDNSIAVLLFVLSSYTAWGWIMIAENTRDTWITRAMQQPPPQNGYTTVGIIIFGLLNCFWWNRSLYYYILLCHPSEDSLQGSAIPVGSPSEDWQSTVGWVDCWIRTQDCSFTMGCHYQWATTAPINEPPLLPSMSHHCSPNEPPLLSSMSHHCSPNEPPLLSSMSHHRSPNEPLLIINFVSQWFWYPAQCSSVSRPGYRWNTRYHTREMPILCTVIQGFRKEFWERFCLMYVWIGKR
jgi:hypothetical protein